MTKRFLLSLLEIVEFAIITVGAVYAFRTLVVQPFLVSGESMARNFSHGDYLLVDQITYRFREPERGEVVVFKYPNDESTYFIKRIIALPGERVRVANGQIYIHQSGSDSGTLLKEEYLPSGTVTSGSVDTVLKTGEYFVLGDNRSYSFDSRSWGILPERDIVGIARIRLYPFTSMKAFAAPQYNQ